MSLILSSNERDVIERTVSVNNNNDHNLSEGDVYYTYEVDRTIEVIKKNGFKRIALQLPDELLHLSYQISSTLKNKLGKDNIDVFILGDTSYGSCCVDEIAASHVGADFIVHYGRACLSSTDRLPVLYVYGKSHLNIALLTDELQKVVTLDAPLLIFYDVEYAHIKEDIEKSMNSRGFTKFSVSQVPTETFVFSKKDTPSSLTSNTTKCGTDCCRTELNKDDCCETNSCSTCDTNTQIINTTVSPTNNTSSSSSHTSTNTNTTKIFGRTITTPSFPLNECTFLWIGKSDSPTLLNVLMTYNQSKILRFDVDTAKIQEEKLPTNKSIMRRYHLIERAKDAQVFGIVVGTLGVSRYLDIIEHSKKLITDSHRKYYVIVVGKLNEFKLANFSEIDIFVLVACPENSLVDNKKYYRPVITPFELDIALNAGLWTGDYTTDFSSIFEHHKNAPVESEKKDELTNEEEVEGIRYSLISQSIVSAKTSKTKIENDQSSSTQIVPKGEQTLIVYDSPAAQFLANRTYKGLDLTDDAPIQLAEEGRRGIAKGYQNEGNT
eukprot:TRINITY_DN5275_c0_g2_i1.p1 TRINITY_DN5275_c0_g2~~TRINITY_DN5275_c0_g2_i1.p1  ORF type:complete len:550 (-),score=118.60 TRINITY_DN5275_c0_g2_i1:24-1673(-)